MEIFNLPHTTKVGRVIPKNAFDAYTNTKLKKLFTDLVARITWTNKLSADTVRLEGKEIKEIQLFKIELKKKEDVQGVMDVIDKAIPYNIVFVVVHGAEMYFSTSLKHPHPLNEDNSVIDWTFKSDWFNADENKYTLNLKKTLDAVFHDLCLQLSGRQDFSGRPIQELIEYKKQVDTLEKEIAKLKSNITRAKQYKDKVALNLRLKEFEKELLLLEGKG